MLGATWWQGQKNHINIISIHAPMLGATDERTWVWAYILYFNPRPYVRSDICFPRSYPPLIDFNPRPYVRSDLTYLMLKLLKMNFNPRPYVRSDQDFLLMNLQSILISIHAPMLGATPGSTTLVVKLLNFNPRPYVRSDFVVLSPLTIAFNFNPRPYVRSDFIIICITL